MTSIYEAGAPPGYRYHDNYSGFLVPSSDKPNENPAYVEDWCRRRIWLARNHYRALQEIQDVLYEHYDLETAFEVPVDGHKVIYPGPRVVVNTVVDHIIPMLPYVKCEPANGTRKAKTNANLNEKVHNGVLYMANRQATDYRCEVPVRATAKDGVIAGELCWEVYDQSYLWGKEPAEDASDEDKEAYADKLDKWCGAYIGCVDPRHIMFDPATPSRWCVKEYNRYSRDIQGTLMAWKAAGIAINWTGGITQYDLAIDTMQKWTEYWGEGPDGESIKAFFVSDQLVAGPIPNPGGEIPFVKAVVGYGRGGPGTPPEKRAWGLIRTALSLFDAMNRRLSQMDAIVERFAWPTWRYSGNTQKMDLNLGPNQVSYVPMGANIEPLYPPAAVLEPILAEMQQLSSQIEWATVPDTLRGFRDQGREAASMYVTRVQEARLVLESLYTAQHQALQEVGRKASKILKRQGKPVTLSGMTQTRELFRATIKPDDIDPRLQLKIELQQEIPAENERRQMLGLQLLEKQVISWWEYQEVYRKEADPDRILDEIAEFQFLQDPFVKAMRNEQIAMAFDIDMFRKMVAARDARMGAMQAQQRNLLGAPGGGQTQPGQQTPDGTGAMPAEQLAMQDAIAVNDQNVVIPPVGPPNQSQMYAQVGL